jgi:putative flippase GtrA
MALTQEALRFGGSGVANTVVGLACIFAAKAVGVGDVPANLFGYGIGLALSFFLNRRWTFSSQGAVLPQAWRFLLSFGVAYCLNLITVLGMRDLVGLDAYVAQLLGVFPYAASFFLLSRYLVFKDGESGN